MFDLFAARFEKKFSCPVVGMGVQRINVLLDSPGFKAGGLVLLMLSYFIVYLKSSFFPCEPCTKGWWEHWDQGKLLTSAQALAKGEVTPETYWYPLGYPALGALFMDLLPNHPFLPANVMCLFLAVVFFWRISRRFLSPVQTVLVFILVSATLGPETEISLVKPWNTIPTMALAYALILEQFCPQPKRLGVTVQFAMVGVVFLIRPSDALFLLPLPLLAAFRGRDLRAGVLMATAGGGLFVLFPLAVILVNLQVFGNPSTPYEAQTSAVGFFSQPLPMKIYSLFVDALPVYGQARTALLPRMPWLLLAPVGLVAAWREERSGTTAFLIAAGSCLLVYLGYNDFTPLNVYAFELIHYLYWMLPLLVMFSFLGVVRRAVFRPNALAALGMAGLALLLVRPEEAGRFGGSIDSQGRVVMTGSANVVDALEVDALAAMPSNSSALRDGSEALRPFKDYLLWNGPERANIVFTQGRSPEHLRVLPEELRNKAAVLKSYRWSLRPPADFPELALRLFGGKGLFIAPPRTVIGAEEQGLRSIEVNVEGPEYLLRGASAWFVTLAGVGGFSSADPPPLLTFPLRVSDTASERLSGKRVLVLETDRTLPAKPLLTVSPLDRQGRALMVWEGRVSVLKN